MPTMRPLTTAALLVSAAFDTGGCGGESDEDEIESVLRGYIAHYIESEPAEMYALLNSASRGRCNEQDFTAFITRTRQALGDREFEVVEVRNIVIDGDTATATVQSRIDGEPRSRRRTRSSGKTAPGSWSSLHQRAERAAAIRSPGGARGSRCAPCPVLSPKRCPSA